MKQKKLFTGALVMTMALIASTSAYAAGSKENTNGIQHEGKSSSSEQVSMIGDKNITWRDSVSFEGNDALTFDTSDPSSLPDDENVTWYDSVSFEGDDALTFDLSDPSGLSGDVQNGVYR